MDHMALMPGSSMEACSSMPMPLRTMRTEPSRSAPLQVSSWVWPSVSMTVMSTMGPRLGKDSSTVMYESVSRSRSEASCTRWESPTREPTKTRPESRYAREEAMLVSPKGSTLMAVTWGEGAGRGCV